MRKSLILFSLLLVTTFYSFAQEKSKKTPEERATSITKKLTEKLSLNADQAAKVKAITLKRTEKIDQVKSKANGDANAKQTEVKAIKQQWEADLKGILTAVQFETYRKYKEEKKLNKKTTGSKTSKNKSQTKSADVEKDEDGD